jgi:replication factor A1
MKVSELRPGMSRVDIRVRVLDVSEPVEIVTREGRRLRLQKAEVGDATGRITLTLWQERIGSVDIGDVIQLTNAFVTSFRGEWQLNVGKYGKLEKIEDISFPKAEAIPKKGPKG